MTDLSVAELTVEFESAGYRIRPLDGLTFRASSGELMVVYGPSGSGKTTLLSCLAGTRSPTRGEVVVGGADITRLQGSEMTEYRLSTVGVLFRASNLLPALTVRENVELPFRLGRRLAVEARERAEELLTRVGQGERMLARPDDLSLGERKRVAIARALMHDPPVLLADEPTARLDHIQMEVVVRLLRELATAGRLVVVATHDHRILPIADRVVELAPRAAGTSRSPGIVELRKGEVLFEQGDPSDLVYVVERGEMQLYRVRADGAEDHVATAGPGRSFGELGPTMGLPRSTSARAVVPSTLTAYTAAEFRGRFRDVPVVVDRPPAPAPPP